MGGNLKPQTTTNFNRGIVLTSDSGFNGSVDYWNYDYEDLIGPGESASSILVNECSRAVYTPDERVTRDGNGQAISVVNNCANLGGVKADGLDVTAEYTIDGIMGGELTLNSNITYIMTYDIDSGDGSAIFDGANNRNSSFGQLGSVPDTRFNIGFDWRSGEQSASFCIRHIGGYDDRTQGNEYDAIASQTVLDAQYSYDFDQLFGQDVTNLTLGVNNLTDEEPPAVDRSSADGRRAFDSLVHDPRGRIMYARFKHTF